MEDGSDNQFDGAMELVVGVLTTNPPTWDSVNSEAESLGWFTDVDYSDLQFLTPLAGTSSGVKAASIGTEDFTLDGTATAILFPGTEARLSQLVNLTAATGTVTLSFDRWHRLDSNLSDAPLYWRVVLRSPDTGEVLDTIEEITTYEDMPAPPATLSADISAWAGESVVLSFELRDEDASAAVDDVSIVDEGGMGEQFVQNGDFETGDLSAWTAASVEALPSGVTTPAETMSGLEVTRSFFAMPRSYWGRWVDSFHNPTDTEITVDVVYYTNLGSDGDGILYETPGVTGAVTAWDGTALDARNSEASDRDVAVVSGTGTLLFKSATEIGAEDGEDLVWAVHHITVPAGETVSLASFIVMTGVDTGALDTTVDATARATLADEKAAAIARHFGDEAVYRDGMTQEQIDTIANF